MTTKQLCAFLAGLCLLAPPSAEAVDFRIEIAPLVSIPVAPFIDGLIISELSFATNIGQAELASISDLEHSVGGGIGIGFLFNDFEIRYELMSLSFSKQRFTHLGLILADVSLFVPIGHGPDDVDPASLGLDGSARDISSLDSLLVHNVGIGWRFVPFEEWTVQPYVPFALGFSAAQLRNDADPMFGFYLQLGAGAQYSPLDWLRVGLDIRYNFAAYKLNDVTLPSLQRTATATLSTDGSAFDSVLEDLQTVNISLMVSIKL